MFKFDSHYPLSVDDERELPADYDGPAYVWDIDKTYLSTSFSSLRGLLRIPLEFAVDKIALPGMPEVIRGLRRGPGDEYEGIPLYFVSASPPQLRRVLEHKMLMDGVEYDGITSKDWLRCILEGRPGRLSEQVGYKLCALLTGKLSRPRSREYLFGDDVEMDAAAFHLYARMINGELAPGDAATEMRADKVKRDDRRCAFALLETLPRKLGRVERIFIHLERNTPPEKFEKFGEMVVPVRGAGQLGLTLYEMDLIDAEAVRQVFEAITERSRSPEELVALLRSDALERGLICEKKLAGLEITPEF
ncbi:MAG: hypothetical protein KKF41_12350 [Actinobacteria bacterium]|nr:hypothetical protein [Actinomycetota bacterium]MBU1943839.1 hypothetical protein [Actinomycetota bacterium]MBU2688366.1 hypothetical protein [Actinomycetota bacterium]